MAMIKVKILITNSDHRQSMEINPNPIILHTYIVHA
jgi:hypothetical protein